ncbi:MAG: cupin [Alphaproteobacteria bacterium]|nr:cupin [Alphaproteobacteria bacterium]
MPRLAQPGAADIIRTLDLKPHPEGGLYAETHRTPAPDGERPAGTAIYYLLAAGERSHWHRIDATEVWHFYTGDALELSLSDGRTSETHRLGPDVLAGERPQVIVSPGVWQAAVTTGAWTLVGCTVSPGFDFSGFEMAPPGWAPAG